MGTVVEVSQESFQDDVLQPSFEGPVVVDFYAQWCGPCQLLKPMLESLSQEYDFLLAKVDIDQNPQLAQAFRVEGVPDVRLISDGQVHPWFVGVLAEADIRKRLQELGLSSALESGLSRLADLQIQQGWDATRQELQRLLEQFPGNLDLQIQAAQLYMQHDEWANAEAILAQTQPKERSLVARVEGMRGLMNFRHMSQELANEASTPPAKTFLQACQATLAGDYEAALEGFLAVVRSDRSYRDDGARKAMLTLFQVLGDDHPLTMSYRKQLMQALY